MEHDLWSILPAWFLTRSELRASAMPEPRILTAGRMLNRQGAYFARLNTISARPPCLFDQRRGWQRGSARGQTHKLLTGKFHVLLPDHVQNK